MKKLILLLLLIPSLCFGEDLYARLNMATIGAGVVASGALTCTTSDDVTIETTLYDAGDSPGANSQTTYVAGKVVLTATSRITALDVALCDNGATGSYTVELWTDDGGEPGSIYAAGATVTLGNASVRTCNYYVPYVSFPFATPIDNVPAGTYWVVGIEVSSFAVKVGLDSTGATGERYCTSTDGSTWTCGDNATYGIDVKGCQ